MIPLSPDERTWLASALPWFGGFATAPAAVASLAEPRVGALHFVDGRYRNDFGALPAGACLLHPPDVMPPPAFDVVAVARPRHEIARLSRALQLWRRKRTTYRMIDGATIAEGAVLGRECVIEPGAWIDAGARLGDRVEVMAGAVLRGAVVAGDGCRFHPHSRVGVDGFGLGFDDAGRALQIAHLGGVRLGREVDVGPGTTVCAGTIDSTQIGDWSKLDGNVYVGHNAIVGESVQVAAGAVIGGSARLGDRALIYPGALIKTKIDVGADAVVGLGAATVKHVGDGETVMGGIAGELRARLRREAGLDHLLRETEAARNRR